MSSMIVWLWILIAPFAGILLLNSMVK